MAEVSAADQLKLLQTTAQQNNDRGYEARNVDSFTVDVTGIALSKDNTVAEVSVCIEDGVAVVLPTATGDSVVNDTFASTQSVLAMGLTDDGRWLVGASTNLRRSTGKENSLCA